MQSIAAGRERQSRITSALTLAVGADTAVHEGHGHALTQMFTLAAHLVAHDGDMDEDDFVTELLGDGWRAIEGVPETGTQRVLTAVADGEDWWRAAQPEGDAGDSGDGDGGGGGGGDGDVAVRASAAGLAGGANLSVVSQLARRSAMVTDAHPDALDAAAVQACAVALVLAEVDFGTVDADKFVAVLSGQCRRRHMRDRLAAIGTICRQDWPADRSAAVIGDDESVVTAPEAVVVALAAFLRHPSQPLRAIEWVRAMGVRWHPAAIMTAVIGGAANPQARPSIMWPVTEQRAKIQAAATGLAAVTPAREHRQLRPTARMARFGKGMW